MLESQAIRPSTDLGITGQRFSNHSAIQAKDPKVTSTIGSKGRLRGLQGYSVIARCRGAIEVTNIDESQGRAIVVQGHVHQVAITCTCGRVVHIAEQNAKAP